MERKKNEMEIRRDCQEGGRKREENVVKLWENKDWWFWEEGEQVLREGRKRKEQTQVEQKEGESGRRD